MPEADSSAGSSGGVNAVRLVLAHTHTYTLYGIVLAREYDMHTSVHELCMHNFIHTLYCAYLSVLLVQCTLYTTRIVCIREYYELVCILLASTLEYGMHTTTLVVVIPTRTIHTMHTN